ncbi:hypothetical protein TRVL_02182 [Trypanosoma vivax]|nr:hypothetical protein TRVL_02182 [Trypanosoma vivax]
MRRLRGQSLTPVRRRSSPNPRLIFSSSVEKASGTHGHSVRVLNEDGSLVFRDVGVRQHDFAVLSIFYTLRAQSWITLILYTLLLYLAIVFVFSAGYLGWAYVCGAQEGVSWVSAMYFTVVSLAANGGYAGEHSDTMLQSDHLCFAGRTVAVIVLSFLNIIVVGLVAALVVGKAAYGEGLGRRIVFSDFCSLNTTHAEGGSVQWQLVFRVANSNRQKPLASGKLRLFVVMVEEMHSALGHEQGTMSAQQQCKSARQQPYRRQHFRQDAPVYCYTGDHESEQHAQTPLLRGAEHLWNSGLKESSFGNETKQLQSGGRGRPHFQMRDLYEMECKDASLCSKRTDTTVMGVESSAPIVEATGECLVGRDMGTTNVEVLPANDVLRDGAGGESPSVFVSRASYRGNSPPSSKSEISASTDSKDATHEGHPRTVLTGGTGDFEQVRICVKELQWTCNEEKHVDGGNGELLLWFPVTIVHTIDVHSPLYKLMDFHCTSSEFLINPQSQLPCSNQTAEGPNLGAPSGAFGPNRPSFQLVATLDAVDVESGAPITAKRTYNTSDIVKFYRFSNKMMRVPCGESEVLVDYHYFNEMLPT